MHNRNNHSATFRQLLALIATTALAVVTPQVSADEEDAAAAAARHFLTEQAESLGDDVTVTIRPSAAQLPPCENPQPFLPFDRPVSPGNLSIGVFCGNDQRHARYLGAHIAVMGHYFTTGRPIRAGNPIDSSALTEQYGDLSQLPDSIIGSAESAAGKTAKLNLKPGTILLSHHLASPPAVSRGEMVVIASLGNGFRITRQGEALDSGHLGDTVRVRLPNRKTLATQVTAPGTVTIATR